jgi:hypothetical protein
MGKHTELWLEGWRRGDAQMILSAITDDFVYEDPVDGRFTRPEFEAYLTEILQTGSPAGGFEAIDDVVTIEKDGEELTWGWWTTLTEPGQEGAGLVKARPDGVYLERVTYFTPME